MKSKIKRYLSLLLVFLLSISPINKGSITVNASETSSEKHVVISQVYGGGGNSGALFTHDFIELYNPTSETVSLEGWSVQYASVKGTSYGVTKLSGSIGPGKYYLVQQAPGNNKELPTLPTPDASGSFSMNGNEFKVALVKSITAISVKSDANVVDFVGVGGADEFEGSAPATIISKSTAARRINNIDTDNNAADFEIVAPTPRNSSYIPAAETKCAIPTASVESGKPVQANTVITFSTTTEDAVIKYNEVSADYDGLWTTASTATVTTATTYYVRAEKEGLESSDVAEFSYTIETKCATPTATVASGKMLQKDDKVTFSTTTVGATIEYNTVSAEHDEWITGGTVTITEDITYYVRAVKEGLDNSGVVAFSYTVDKRDPNAVMNIKEVLELPGETANVIVEGQLVYFAQSYGNPVIQTKIDGQTYSLYVYGAAPAGAKIGDILRLKGNYKVYNGLPELEKVTESEIIGEDTPMEAEVVTIAQLKTDGKNMIGRFVKLENVTLGTYNSSGNTPITQGSDSINIYRATPYPTLVEEGDVVDVYAMVAAYNTTIQLYTGTKEANGYNVYDVVNDTKAPLITLPETYLEAKVNQDYYIWAEIQDNKDITEATITYTIGEVELTKPLVVNNDTGRYEYTIPGSEILGTASDIKFTIKANDAAGHETVSELQSVVINSAPQIIDVSPRRNSSTGDNKAPVISVTLDNAGISPTVTLTLKKDNTTIIDNKTMTLVESEPSLLFNYTVDTLVDGTYEVFVTVLREDSRSTTETWRFTVGEAKYKAYFGQLHAHTAEYSDGSGTLQNGLDYIKNIAKNDNVDFSAFTDHSNYFDSSSSANPADALNDKTKMTTESLAKWNKYVSDMDTFNQENAGSIIALAGFEMTWSGGPGHINTFNSDGLISRNNKDLNNKSADAGMKLYYETLIQNTDPLANLSQFNHPGTTFGTFSDFAYWSPAYDNKMVAVEVGNGEGAIGSGGYFPSYAEYTKALDKGWHVAPTNNQDNHKGKWGNGNTARTVIITDNLSEEGLLNGLKNRSVYATEDKNLTIDYKVNDLILGSIISEVPTEPLKFDINIVDEDANDVISKVEVISNGGRIVNSKTFDSNTVTWSFELAPIQGYYYLRVTQADKNIAVTAPVWVGQAPLVGISSFEASTKLPVTEEPLGMTTTLFNNEEAAVKLVSIEYALGETVLKTDNLNTDIEPSTTYNHTFEYEFASEGEATITVTAKVLVDGVEKVFNKEINLVIRDKNKLVYVGIDASHFNEYVRGNYKDSMGNFANMAVEYGVRVVELETTEELIAATKNPQYKMLVLTPPTRRNGSAFLIGYKNYSDEVITAVKEFAESGKTVILTGWGDYYESYNKYSDGTPYQLPATDHMSAQQNKILKALGSNLRISDDEIKDDTNNGGQPMRLYLTEYNLDNPFLARVKPAVLDESGKVLDGQVYSNYGGSTVYSVGEDKLPSETLAPTVSPMVYAFTSSYSADDDKDGTTGTGIDGVSVPKYNNKYMVAASESITYENGKTATVIVAGSAFMSNFEIKVESDNYSTPEYSNYTILENVVRTINPLTITDIADVHAAEEGVTFTIRGIVTSNASGYDKDTAFFDCIYLQDSTAGINAFPVAGDIRAGQTVEITGKTSSYNGERQIAVEKIEIIDETVKELPAPITLTTAEAADGNRLGSLVKVSGTVQSIIYANDVVESIFIKDSSNKACRIFIDGYITSTKEIASLAVGAKVTAIGMSSIDTEGTRIRVRDRADVVVIDVGTGPRPDPTPVIDEVVNVDDQGDQPNVIITSNIKATLVNNAKLEAKADNSTVSSAIRKALEEAKKIENEESIVEVEINVAIPGFDTLKEVDVKISAQALADIAKSEVERLKVSSAIGSVTLDKNTVQSLITQGSNEFNIIIKKVDNLEKELTEIVKDRPVYNLTIQSGNKEISQFNGGNVVVRIPYELKEGESAENIVVYYINADNELEMVQDTNYNTITKEVYFTTTHFSYYTISHELANTQFSDVKETAWYHNALQILALRRIIVGTTANKFEPNKAITRAEFVMMLAKLSGADLTKYTKVHYSDVTASDWYFNATSWAKSFGVAQGNEGKFSPNATLTRQEMAVMIANYMDNVAKEELPISTTTFTDNDEISEFAKVAVSQIRQSGIVVGKPENMFAPKDTLTRAEAVQVINNILK